MQDSFVPWKIVIEGIPMPKHIHELHSPRVVLGNNERKPDYDELYCDLRIYEGDRCVFSHQMTSLGWGMQSAAMELRLKTALELGVDPRFVVEAAERRGR